MDEVFQYCTPESTGISSGDVLTMLKVFQEEGLYMHSVMVVRYGKIIAEGYYAPFTRQTKHRMYSVSKSFVSGAIGLLCGEGRLSLEDKIHTFFPEFPPEELHPYIREMTVRDLLRMESPHTTTYSLCPGDRYYTDWVESFFRTKPVRPAGTTFCYDTSATYILDVIVERLTGKSFLEYMKDKMLRKLGFSEDAWCVKSPDGYAWGGSGVICTPLDLAKYAFVLLRNGRVNGEQLLSGDYIKAATACQTASEVNSCMFESGGYGYQIWCAPDNGFSFLGMGSQFVYCLPEKDLMFICTADNQGRDSAKDCILGAFLHHVARKAAGTPLPEDPVAYDALQKELNGLSLTVPRGCTHSSWEEKINNVTYLLEENPMGFQKVRLSFRGDGGTLYYRNARGEKEIPFGLGKYEEGRFPETHYSGTQIGVPKGEGYRCLAAAVWTTETQLLLRVNIVDDYFGNLRIVFGFQNDKIGITMGKTAEAFLDDYSGFAGGRAER